MSAHPRLDGEGGMRSSSRWNTRGRRVVYCAPNPATALLEVLVHAEIDLEDVPLSFRYLEIETPASLDIERPSLEALGADWVDNLAATRQTGDEWLRSGRTPLLEVPSVLVPATSNFLINPAHGDSVRIGIKRHLQHPLDARLLKRVQSAG